MLVLLRLVPIRAYLVNSFCLNKRISVFFLFFNMVFVCGLMLLRLYILY